MLGIVGNDENHRLTGLVDAISHLIASYEELHFSEPKIDGIAALKCLMRTNHLSQSDLPDIASQDVLSEILSDKRPLNLRQIKLPSKRFEISSATFIEG